MALNIVVPVLSTNGLCDFIEKLQNIKKENLLNATITIVANTNIDLSGILLFDNDIIIKIKEDTLQQLIMAGLDASDADAQIIITQNYPPSSIIEMIEQWKKGVKIVNYKIKLKSKLQSFLAQIGKSLNNIVLRIFSKTFNLGNRVDIQLLDKSIVDIMKKNQTYASHIRNMYANFEYSEKTLEANTITQHVSVYEKDSAKKAGNTFFLLSVLFTLFVVGIITMITFGCGIGYYIVYILSFSLIGFLTGSLFATFLSQAKFGILYKEDENGKIYNVDKYSIIKLRKDEIEDEKVKKPIKMVTKKTKTTNPKNKKTVVNGKKQEKSTNNKKKEKSKDGKKQTKSTKTNKGEINE